MKEQGVIGGFFWQSLPIVNKHYTHYWRNSHKSGFSKLPTTTMTMEMEFHFMHDEIWPCN